MRRAFIAGNWKMNLGRNQAVALASAIARRAGDFPEVDVAVCPPAVWLEAVAAVLQGSRTGLGAQNMHHEASGAYTGEISAAMLLEVGCRIVILGHSERRQLFHETDADINAKLHAALAAGLEPIVCVGETLQQRQRDETDAVIRRQFEGSLAEISAEEMARTTIAYEPVWAIGTGQVATPEQAEAVHLGLRRLIEQRYNASVARAVRIQYGGSVKPDNAAELLAQPNIDGALVGGASLKEDDFLAIVAAA